MVATVNDSRLALTSRDQRKLTALTRNGNCRNKGLMLNHENDSVTADENAVPGVLLFYCHQSLQSAIQLLRRNVLR